jgi:hypothetical protein
MEAEDQGTASSAIASRCRSYAGDGRGMDASLEGSFGPSYTVFPMSIDLSQGRALCSTIRKRGSRGGNRFSLLEYGEYIRKGNGRGEGEPLSYVRASVGSAGRPISIVISEELTTAREYLSVDAD